MQSKDQISSVLNHTSANTNLFEYHSTALNIQSERMLTFIFSITEKEIIDMIKNNNFSFTKNEFFSSIEKKYFLKTFNITYKYSKWKDIENELKNLYLNVEDKNGNLSIKIFNKINFENELTWSINPKFLDSRFRQMNSNNFFVTTTNEVKQFTSKHTFKLFRFFKSKTFLNNQKMKILVTLPDEKIKKLLFCNNWEKTVVKQNIIERNIKPVLNDLNKDNQALFINNFFITTNFENELQWNFEIEHDFNKLKSLDKLIFKNMRIINLWRKEAFDELQVEIMKQEKTEEIKIKTITEDGQIIDYDPISVEKKIPGSEEYYDDDFWELDD